MFGIEGRDKTPLEVMVGIVNEYRGFRATLDAEQQKSLKDSSREFLNAIGAMPITVDTLYALGTGAMMQMQGIKSKSPGLMLRISMILEDDPEIPVPELRIMISEVARQLLDGELDLD